MALIKIWIRRVFVYVSISIISFISIHHLILPTTTTYHDQPASFNHHHLFIPLIQNDAVSEKLYQLDNNNDDVTSSTSSSTKFNTDHDVTNSQLVVRTQSDDEHYDVKSPLVVVTGFDNDDVTSSSISSKNFDVESPLIVTGFHNDDVTSSTSSSTKFNADHDVTNSPLVVTGFDNDDVTSSISSSKKFDVESPLIVTGFDNDDVTSSISSNGDVSSPPLSHRNSTVITGFDNDDVTSTHFYDVKSPLTDVSSSSSTGFDNDDVTASVSSPAVADAFDDYEANSSNSTRFQDYDVNSPIIRQFDLNSSVSTPFGKDDVMILNVNVSVLFPGWEALVIVRMDNVENSINNKSIFYCLFDTSEVTEARFYGTLSFSRETYTCRLPTRFRRRLPFRQPVLTNTKDDVWVTSASPELLRWNYIVYDVIDNDENDVILLVKGINSRQGVNRSPKEFRCLFGDDLVKGVVTDVSSSLQEVFRCKRPDLSHFTGSSQSVVKASLVIVEGNHVVPSIAYYEPRRRVVKEGGKKLLCACTMVYNVAKFLKEWVIYHANIGVEKFVLYDNGSDDDLGAVVEVLKSRGYDVEVRFWLWPKTQEAGFSHAAFVDKGSCKWMMYIDVDEFVYSPKWKSLKPSKGLLPSLLPASPYGQVTIKCYEFGPSGQKRHPLTGVTQGYNCRKEVENRHKSIVLLDAVHESLLNMIHHFKLKDGYRIMKVELESVAVNHYKYQAWVEFKAKFRRRVSAYVVDWTRSVNLKSNDRAPGLGNLAVKPDGWEDRFCGVHDNRLRDLTRRWFGRRNGRSGVRMAWQI